MTTTTEGMVLRPWTGIYGERPTCRYCSWVWDFRAGCFQIKHISGLCTEHRRAA